MSMMDQQKLFPLSKIEAHGNQMYWQKHSKHLMSMIDEQKLCILVKV